MKSLPRALRAFFAAWDGGSFASIGSAIADMLDREIPEHTTEYTRLLSEALDRLKRAAAMLPRRGKGN